MVRAVMPLDIACDGVGEVKLKRATARRQELTHWAVLAISSLTVSGVMAFLLALSRVPGIENIFPWPLGFFGKGLVIHVVFSLVVWFLTCFAFLATLAYYEDDRAALPMASLGQTGANLVTMAFPFLLIPAFLDDSSASLNNYVPILIHRSYYFGLVLLALGIAMPALRLLTALRTAWSSVSHTRVAATAGAIIYLVALTCVAIALVKLWGSDPTRMFHEQLFWGMGHVLQFLNATLLLTGWFVLLRASIGEDAFDPSIFRIAVTLIAVFALAAPLLYLAFPAFSTIQTEAFRRLQFVLAFPSLVVAVGSLTGGLRAHRTRPLPWHDPAFIALILSPIVFGAGGVMGLLITSSDTRTPAHYHGVITGVNLVLIGLFIKVFLPAIGRSLKEYARMKTPIILFGAGQFVACIGLFLAGGYGAPRKAAAGTVHLVDGAIAGLYLHGLGALFAIIGGTMFVVAMLRALLWSAPNDGALVRV